MLKFVVSLLALAIFLSTIWAVTKYATEFTAVNCVENGGIAIRSWSGIYRDCLAQ